MRYLHLLPVYLAKVGTVGDVWKWLLAAIGSAISYVLPSADIQGTTLAVLGFIFLDTLSGSIVASRRKRWRTRSFGRLYVKLFGYFVIVLVASITLKEVMPSAPEAREVLLRFLLWAVLLTEAKSILENVQKMGVTVPPWLLRIIRDRAKQIADDASVKMQGPTDDADAEEASEL